MPNSLLQFFDAVGNILAVSPSNPLPIGAPTGSTIGTPTSVASAAADTVILAANAARRGATIYNDSANNLFLLLGNHVSSNTVYTIKMVSDSYYEVPFGYVGIIKGIWDVAAGFARVTELT